MVALCYSFLLWALIFYVNYHIKHKHMLKFVPFLGIHQMCLNFTNLNIKLKRDLDLS